ncbi:MAG: hypothetical protein HC925_02390 [Coleofasciculaceae cyanobacterium SM2_3_26]|nr:hypothetical protein [Coleofasciculaceae cyanobacterium SM2_3_26]
MIDGYTLMGALHRDGYAIVLTGADPAVFAFAAWYRDIARQSALYLYAWADVGYRLEKGVSVGEIAHAATRREIHMADEQDDRMTSPPRKARKE